MELNDLSPVLSAEGPFVTVHVDAESDVEQAADKYELEWKALLQQLDEQDVAAPVRQALSEARGEHPDGGSRLVVVSVPDAAVRLAVSLPSRVARTTATIGELPDLLPLVDDLTTRVPYVSVLVDRRGAEISARFDMDTLAKDVTVKGTELHLTKVGGGGWSHRRYLHRVEEQWETNARAVAEAVTDLAGIISAEVVIAAGDLRATQLLRDNLPTALQDKLIVIQGTRGGDGSEQLTQQRIADALSVHVARGTLDLLGEFAQERGQDKRACDGVDDVVDALRKAQVETLLVTTRADEQPLFFGEEATQIGRTRDEVTALGATTVKEAPLVPVLLRAALGTGAAVQLVPDEPVQAPAGGVGAVLRYVDADR